MFMIELKEINWWYWLVISSLLNVSMFGIWDTYHLLMAVSTINLIHYALRERSLVVFPVQVRFAFLVFLMIAYSLEMRWLCWVPAIGTIARVLFGYCLLARMLMLLPNNRKDPLNWAFVSNAFFAAPIRGSVLHGLGK